jgi:hypothetical protein
MPEIAQTYVHLRPYELDSERINQLGYAVQESAIQAAVAVYGGGVNIDVKLEAGSVKGWVTIGGIIGALQVGYGAVADYKGFKESIVEICEDAKKFGTIVSDAFSAKARVSPDSVYRVEKRLKVPGKIKRVFTKMEVLDQMAAKMSASEIAARIAEIEHELQAIEKELTSEEKLGLHQLTLYFENLPLFKGHPKEATVPGMAKVALPVPSPVWTSKAVMLYDTAHMSSGAALPFEVSVPALSFRNSVFVPAERRGPQWPPVTI